MRANYRSHLQNLFRIDSESDLILIFMKNDSIKTLLVQYIYTGSIVVKNVEQTLTEWLNEVQDVEVVRNLLSKSAASKDSLRILGMRMVLAEDGLFYLLAKRVPVANRIKDIRKISKSSISSFIENLQVDSVGIDLNTTYNALMQYIKLNATEKLLLQFTFQSHAINHLQDIRFEELTIVQVFQLAAICGSLKSLQLLWDMLQDDRAKQEDVLNDGEDTTLNLATMSGQQEVVQWLLEKGANVRAGNHYGDMAIHLAASQGARPLVELLLSKSDQCNSKNKDGKTPLHKAAEGGHLNVLQFLLDHGAAVDVANFSGNTPLIRAAERGHTAIVEALLTSGASVLATNNRQNSGLHRAAFHGHIGVVDLLLHKGADMNGRNIDGKTPLHIASERGWTKVVELLLSNGGDIAARNSFGQTPLHEAAWKGHTDIAEMLLRFGADGKATDHKMRTALHEAAWNGFADIVKLLLENHVDAIVMDYSGATPAQLAHQFKHTEIVEILSKSDCGL